MVVDDLTEEDWRELYQFLVTQLEAAGLSATLREVEEAAASPVAETPSKQEEESIRRRYKGEVGSSPPRQRRADEVFGVALEVLWHRLTELPRIARRTGELLKIDPDSIVIELDQGGMAVEPEKLAIRLGDFILAQGEEQQITEIFGEFPDLGDFGKGTEHG